MLENFENKWFNLECVSQRCLSLLDIFVLLKRYYHVGM